MPDLQPQRPATPAAQTQNITRTNPPAASPGASATTAALRGANSYAEGRQIVSPSAGASPGDVVAGWVVYPTEARKGGSLAWRNNNPGNIRRGAFAEAHGAYPGKVNAGFAIFPTHDQGFAAIADLLKEPLYADKSVTEAVKTYAPASDNNNPAAYARFIEKVTGLDGTTVLNTLTDEQLQGVARAIATMEGSIEGTTVSRQDPQLPPSLRLP